MSYQGLGFDYMVTSVFLSSQSRKTPCVLAKKFQCQYQPCLSSDFFPFSFASHLSFFPYSNQFQFKTPSSRFNDKKRRLQAVCPQRQRLCNKMHNANAMRLHAKSSLRRGRLA
jgi:hypothetical protein